MKTKIVLMLLALVFSTFVIAKENTSKSIFGESVSTEEERFGKYYSSWVVAGKTEEYDLPDGAVFPSSTGYFAIDNVRDLIVFKTVYDASISLGPYIEAQIKLDDNRIKTSFNLISIDCKTRFTKNIASFSMNEKNELIKFEAASEYESNQYTEPHKDSVGYAIMQKYEMCLNK